MQLSEQSLTQRQNVSQVQDQSPSYLNAEEFTRIAADISSDAKGKRIRYV